MSKRIFVSFRYSDTDFRNDILQFFDARGGPVAATPVYLTEDVASAGDTAIKKEIQRAMEDCRGLVVVVGDDSHNSRWVGYEIGLAASLKIPCVALRHPSAHGGLPNSFKGMTEIEWKPVSLAAEVASWK